LSADAKAIVLAVDVMFKLVGDNAQDVFAVHDHSTSRHLFWPSSSRHRTQGHPDGWPNAPTLLIEQLPYRCHSHPLRTPAGEIDADELLEYC
jgi:hypothetical protein